MERKNKGNKRIFKIQRFKERLSLEELNDYVKEFKETILIYSPTCDELMEIYYGICLNCGDDSEKKFALNKKALSIWMPNDDLKGVDKALAIRKYLKEKEDKGNSDEDWVYK